MDAYEYALAVAIRIDSETGLPIAQQLVQTRKQDLDRVIGDDEARRALHATLVHRVPEALVKELFPNKSVASVRRVAKLIICAACCETTNEHPSREHWSSCEVHREALQDTVSAYLDGLCGRVPDPERLRQQTSVAIEEIMDAANRALSDRVHARWAKQLLDSRSVLLLAEHLGRIPEGSRQERLVEVAGQIMGRGETLSPQEFSLLLTHAERKPSEAN